MTQFKLVIGNKTYSSWSLRPWVLLKHFGIPFEEILVKLDLPGTTVEILKYSPSGRVPALIDGDLVIWDSLAIMEYLNEKIPALYPADQKLRAKARSMANEMHSGFAAMREHLSFHAKKHFENYDLSPARKDIDRVLQLWREALHESGGPFLCGEFGIVDAMFAPVVARFQTYGVKLEGACAEYAGRVLDLPAMREWYEGARAETFIAADHE